MAITLRVHQTTRKTDGSTEVVFWIESPELLSASRLATLVDSSEKLVLIHVRVNTQPSVDAEIEAARQKLIVFADGLAQLARTKF